MNLDKFTKVNVEDYYIVPICILMDINYSDDKKVKYKYKRYKYACIKKGITSYYDILSNKKYLTNGLQYYNIGTNFIDLDDTLIPLNQILKLDEVVIDKDKLKKMVIIVLEEMNKVFFTNEELERIEKANNALIKVKK